MPLLTRPHIILDDIAYATYIHKKSEADNFSIITSIKGFDIETGLRVFNLTNTKLFNTKSRSEEVIFDEIELRQDTSNIIKSKLKYVITDDDYQEELSNYYHALKNTIDLFGHY